MVVGHRRARPLVVLFTVSPCRAGVAMIMALGVLAMLVVVGALRLLLVLERAAALALPGRGRFVARLLAGVGSAPRGRA